MPVLDETERLGGATGRAGGRRRRRGWNPMEDRQMARHDKPRSASNLATILLLSGAIALLWRLLG